MKGTYEVSTAGGLGLEWEGVGAISGGGATTKLLMDYDPAVASDKRQSYMYQADAVYSDNTVYSVSVSVSLSVCLSVFLSLSVSISLCIFLCLCYLFSLSHCRCLSLPPILIILQSCVCADMRSNQIKSMNTAVR